jgi:hypothetical protein
MFLDAKHLYKLIMSFCLFVSWVVKGGQEWSWMVIDAQGWSKVAKGGQKWSRVVNNGQAWSRDVKGGQGWPRVVKGVKCGQGLSRMVMNGWMACSRVVHGGQ